MLTLEQAHSGGSYFGDRPDWLILAGQHRDSDYLERSNFRVAEQLAVVALGRESVAIERSGHWAVGWIEYVVLAPSAASERLAEDIRGRLEDYPILDEGDAWDEEYKESLAVIANCFIPDHLPNTGYGAAAVSLAPHIYRAVADAGWSEWTTPGGAYPDMHETRIRSALARAIRTWRAESRKGVHNV